VDALERLRRSYLVQMKKMAEMQLAELTAAEHAPLPPRPTPIDASEAVGENSGAKESWLDSKVPE